MEEDFAVSHETPPEVKEKCALIQELVGCGYVTAWKALMEHKGDVVLAIDALMTKPVTKGDAYIPPPPTIDRGLTAEQEERCKKGRWLQDQVNVVFSAAHSKTRTPLDAEGCSSASAPPASSLPALESGAVAPGS